MGGMLMAGTSSSVAALAQVAASGPTVGESILGGVLVLSGAIVLAVNRLRRRPARRR